MMIRVTMILLTSVSILTGCTYNSKWDTNINYMSPIDYITPSKTVTLTGNLSR